MAGLVSIQTGLPQDYPGDQSRNILTRGWTTGFFKSSVSGPITLTPTGLVGDGVADRKVHGGPDKAVLVVCIDHYAQWEAELGLKVPNGGFGENLSVTGISEENVCIGDRWQIGTVVLEVSQPRQPCWKLARRHMLPNLPKLVIQTNRGGWYLRVITPGELSANANIDIIASPNPTWSIARVNQVYYSKEKNNAEVEFLANLPQLAMCWREDFQGML